jgi:hypothetical protein
MNTTRADLVIALSDAVTEIQRLSDWLRELGHPTQDKTCEVIDDCIAAIAKADGSELTEEPSHG